MRGGAIPSAMLFDPLTLRSVTLRNRVGVSPMCEYSSTDGFANDWHLVHLGSRAVGGAGLVMTEATAVEARGRISPSDLGLWKDEHVEALARVTRFVRAQGAVAGTQLAHAGRKGSTAAPWDGPRAVDERSGSGSKSMAEEIAPSRTTRNPTGAMKTAALRRSARSGRRSAARDRAAPDTPRGASARAASRCAGERDAAAPSVARCERRCGC